MALWLGWIPEQTEDYAPALRRIQQDNSLALRLADEGYDFEQFELHDPGFSYPAGYLLRDQNGNLIPENITYIKNYINNHYEAREIALTAPYGPFSAETIISEIQWRSTGPFLIIWAILAVLTFAVDFRDGRYGELLSKGVRRSQILASKVILAAVAAVGFAGAMTLIMTHFGLGAFANMTGFVVPSLGAMLNTSFVLNIFWLSAWMFFTYFLLGGLASLIAFSVTNSYNWAMAITVAVLGIAVGTTQGLTPCNTADYGLFAGSAPVTLGFNFNSLHQFFWLHMENYECYRTPVAAAVIAALFTVLIYMGARLIFMRGRLAMENDR
ncbi:hypothetical protein DGWBC_0580 [Dehalogenimonas sp. WBC-2]|nr:hypothetical protein DGWBC_0580 [Dehalogenimonas sp. WBC-2]